MTSFDEVIPNLKRLKPDLDLVAPADYPPALLPIHAARRMKIPVLLIVGENDDRTPPSMSERILAELRGPKELWIAPGATHGGGNGPEFKYYPDSSSGWPRSSARTCEGMLAWLPVLAARVFAGRLHEGLRPTPRRSTPVSNTNS